jgi:glc operon protein GlcG
MLTLAKSRKIIDGAVQRAEQLNAKISVAVCGRDGGLIAFSRMDGCAGWDVDRSSLGVATAAAIIGGPSDQLSDRCTNGVRIFSYANVVPPRGLRGGLPIVEEGVIEGGCGVSGAATAEESEECTRAGIAAINAARTEPPIGTYPQVKGRPGTFWNSPFQA